VWLFDQVKLSDNTLSNKNNVTWEKRTAFARMMDISQEKTGDLHG
jgi:hypothetical protein